MDKYRIIRVKFWNEFHKSFGIGKEYEYFLRSEDKYSIGEEIELELNKKVKVVDMYTVENLRSTRATKYLDIKENKEGKQMKNTDIKNKMMSKMFQEVTNVKMSIDNMQTGIEKDGSIFTFDISTKDINENIFDIMSFDIPAYAMPLQVSQLSIGDIVVQDGKAIGWVASTPTSDTNKVHIKRTSGANYTITPPKNTIMGGTQSVMVVKNMFSNDATNQQMNPMMMMAMMGGTDKIDPMMAMMMMNQGGGNNMMQTMMMMKMMDK